MNGQHLEHGKATLMLSWQYEQAHDMAAASAVEALIAISENYILPTEKHNSGNFFGPWIPDSNWSPRKNSPVSQTPHKKRTTPRAKRSKSPPRRLSMYTSSNINNSPYAAQDSLVSDNVGQSKRTDSRRAIALLKNSEKADEKSTEPSTYVGGTARDVEEEEENVLARSSSSSFHKPSLPALITLTSDVNDSSSTFALGRQLELPIPKVYVSVAQRQSSRIKNKRTLAESIDQISSKSLDMVSTQQTWDEESGQTSNGFHSHRDQEYRRNVGVNFSHNTDRGSRDVRRCREDALRRALAKRNPPAPWYEHEDISLHMRHYRIHHTVLGTGRFSLANSSDQREIKPVRWADVFPDRPLTAAMSITDVPVFRFSVSDFRSQTAPTSKSARISSSLRRSLTPNFSYEQTQRQGSARDKLVRLDHKEPIMSTPVKSSTVTVVDSRDWSNSVDVPGVPFPADEKEAKSDENARNKVFNKSIQSLKRENSDNAYLLYLKSKKSPRGKFTKKYDSPRNDKVPNPMKNKQESPRIHEPRQKENEQFVSTIRIKEEKPQKNYGEEDKPVASSNEKEVRLRRSYSNLDTKHPKLRKGSNYSFKKCEGQYGPATTHFEGDAKSWCPVHRQQKKICCCSAVPRLVVDTERLIESVDDKIDDDQRKIRASGGFLLEQMLETKKNTKMAGGRLRFPGATGSSGDRNLPGDNVTVHPKTLSKLFESDNNDENEISELQDENEVSEMQDDDDEPEPEERHVKKVSVVTSYDFRGYVQALRSRMKNKENDQDSEEEMQDGEEEAPGSPREKSGSTTSAKKRCWRPSASRVRSAARGGRYRKRYFRNSENRMKPRPPNLDEEQGCDKDSAKSSPRLNFKTLSAATSAVVIAAPPSGRASSRGKSVVLPLDEFMAMACEGSNKSFSEWKTCLNNPTFATSSKLERATGHRSQREGLLKVVSFATPVNQFIFAKKVTCTSGDSLGIYSTKDKKERKPRDSDADLLDSRASMANFRLRLSDFGLPEKIRSRSKEKQFDDMKSGVKTVRKSSDGVMKHVKTKESETDAHINPDKLDDFIEDKSKSAPKCKTSIKRSGTDVTKVMVERNDNETEDILSPAYEESLQAVIDAQDHQSEYLETDKQMTRQSKPLEPTTRVGRYKKPRTLSAEAHECLRREVLRLVEERRPSCQAEEQHGDQQSASARSDNDTNYTSKLTEDNSLTVVNSLVRFNKPTHDSGDGELPVHKLTRSQSDLSGLSTKRQKLSISWGRLTLKHTRRRLSDGAKLSPSSLNTKQVGASSDGPSEGAVIGLDYAPLSIQGGSVKLGEHVDSNRYSTPRKTKESQETVDIKGSTKEEEGLTSGITVHSGKGGPTISITNRKTARKDFENDKNDKRPDSTRRSVSFDLGDDNPGKDTSVARRSAGILLYAPGKPRTKPLTRVSSVDSKKTSKTVRFSDTN